MAERRAKTRSLQSAVGTAAFKPRRTAPPPRQRDDLHICPSCGSELVYPIDWAPAAARRWTVELRCPDCEWRGGGTYDQRVVDRLDEELERGIEVMLGDLGLLARANMEDEVENFVAALHGDVIVPEDF